MNERLEVVPIDKKGTMPRFRGNGGVLVSKNVSKDDEEALIRLYNELTGKDFNQTIDIPLLWEEGIPCFKETLGERDWNIVWKYFKDGYKRKDAKKQKKVEELISKLTTIDNAQHYIREFKECIKRYAELVIDTPEGMSDIIKAKFLRAFEVFFAEYHFFVEDFVLVADIKGNYTKVPFEKNVVLNNKKVYLPEQMFMLYDLRLFEMPDGGFCYPLMMAIVQELDKVARKEFFKFAELEYEDGKLCDKNETVRWTFGEIRKIKMRINTPQGHFPIESYVFRPNDLSANMVVAYHTVRLFDMTEDWTTFPVVEEMVNELECSRVIHRAQRFYEPCKNNLFASITEMERLKRYFEYLTEREFEFMAYFKFMNSNIRADVKFNLKLFMAAQKYFQDFGYYNRDEDNLEIELYLAKVLFEEFDCENSLRKFANGEISCEEFREELGITTEVDKEKFHVIEVENEEDAFERFMKEEGFELTEENTKCAREVIFRGNEETFKEYAEQSIDTDKVKKAIFYKKEVVSKICNLDQVDFEAIEEHLLNMKSSRVKTTQIKKDSLLIKLYCYLVRNQIPCGPKNKKAKPNRRLKTSILESLIE